jgi:hypothetical protein
MENTSEDDSRQEESSKKQKPLRQHSKPTSVVPLIIADGLYCAEQIIVALAISPNSLDEMVEEGLVARRRHTKRRFFVGRDVMQFLAGENPSN